MKKLIAKATRRLSQWTVRRIEEYELWLIASGVDAEDAMRMLFPPL